MAGARHCLSGMDVRCLRGAAVQHHPRPDAGRSHGIGEQHRTGQDVGGTFLGVFLLGGTVGGLAFGSLADRYGRKPTMAVTILFYSVFSGLTYFATELWHVAVLRFLVALGVGGEWAVGATLVAEVFPSRARARASGIFHATSVIGTWLAAAAGLVVGSQWRYAFVVGVLPALLVLWVRSHVQEPERWQRTGKERQAARQLFRVVQRRSMGQAGGARAVARRGWSRHVLGCHGRRAGSHAGPSPPRRHLAGAGRRARQVCVRDRADRGRWPGAVVLRTAG